MTEIFTSVLLLAGGTLGLLAAVGVLRMPDLFTRMQAATKASTLGLGCLLIGAAIHLDDFTSVVRAVSIGAFMALTAPVATHMIARSAFLTRAPLAQNTVVDERRENTVSGAIPDSENPEP
jgi:multicomponent Na+:H+ antiporter subunit G